MAFTGGHKFPDATKRAKSLVKDVVERLDRSASPENKRQIEKYLKTVQSRGNKVPAIRAASMDTLKGATGIPPSDIYAAAFLLLVSKMTDDKYAGNMFLSHGLILSGAIFEQPNAALRDRLLDDIAALFDAGFVSNWSECDGLCGHVIGPFVARHPHRRRVADEVSALTLYHSEFHDCTTRKVTVF